MREIIHFVPPQTVEEYVQHIGQASGEQWKVCNCVFISWKSTNVPLDPHLLNYCKCCDTFRRVFLFQDFDS